MPRVAILTLALVASACSGSVPDERTDTSSGDQPAIAATRATADPAVPRSISWPEDQTTYQLANLDSLNLTVPRCGDNAQLSPDSVGFLQLGQSVSAVAARCADAVPMWDWGDEGIPAPVLLIRIGDTALQLAFEDTLASSVLVTIATGDSSARTSLGVGPGSSFGQLTQAYGPARLVEGECVLHATFASAPGLSFRLDTRRALDCEEIVQVAAANAAPRLPSSTRVSEVFVYRP